MNKGLSFEKEFMETNPLNGSILGYMREAMNVDEVRWCDITSPNMSKVSKLINKECSGNTPQTYISIIKSFLKKYVECLEYGLMPADQLKAKHMPSQNVFLTEKEVELIEQYADRLEKRSGREVEKDVVNAFLIECYCGARGIDVEQFTEENIIDGQLVYISQKTKVMTKVPIHPKIADRLLRKSKKEYADSTKNRIIKRVASKVGIDQVITIFYRGKLQTKPKYEFLGFHTARRSFCSNLANRGVDIYTIAALANHDKDIAMTQRYIIPDIDKLSEEAIKFFKGK